jgi:hypothetical protein
MRALIVFESSFGNTKKIAESIADGLGPDVTATVAEAEGLDVATLDGVDLLVVGAPTHAWGLPRPNSRKGAAQQAPGVASTANTGVREWLATLPVARSGTVATFDTRFPKPRWMTGSAARGAAARLARRGYRVVATESFFVTGTQGPLRDGETERARAWAARLTDTLTSATG